MAGALGRLFVQLTADTEPFSKGLNDAAGKITSFGAGLQDFGTKATTYVSAPLAAVGAALFANTVRVGEMADAILDLSDQTGLSTKTLQEFRHVAVATGSPLDVIAESSRVLFQRFAAVGEESKNVTLALERLGINIRDNDGALRDMDSLLPEIIAKLQGVQNVTERNALATELFGKGASNLAPILATSAVEMEKFRAQAHAMGLVLGVDALKAADDFRQRWDILKASFGASITQVGTQLIPVMTELVNLLSTTLIPALSVVVGWFAKLSPEMQITIGVVAAAVTAIGPLALAVSGLISILPTLTAAFAVLGGATGIGLAIAAFAAVVAAGLQVVEHWDLLKNETIAAFNKIKDVAQALWDGVVGTFTRGIEGVVNVVRTGLDTVTGFFSKMFDVIVGRSIVPDLVDGVLGEFARMTQGMSSETRAGTDAAIAEFTRLDTVGHETAHHAATNIVSAFSAIKGSLSALALDETTKVLDAFEKLGVDVPDSVKKLVKSVSTSWGALTTIMSSPLMDLEKVRTDWVKFFADLGDVLVWFWNRVKGFIDKLIDLFKSGGGGAFRSPEDELFGQRNTGLGGPTGIGSQVQPSNVPMASAMSGGDSAVVALLTAIRADISMMANNGVVFQSRVQTDAMRSQLLAGDLVFQG